MAAVTRIPNEILSEIFIHCVFFNAVTLPSCAPILLTRVCRLWRMVALSTPRLWSYLDLCVGESKTATSTTRCRLGRDEAFIDALKTWLTLSRSTPLTLHLWPSFFGTAVEVDDTFAECIRIMSAHSARWKDVAIILPFTSHELIAALSDCRSLPLLESFSFKTRKAITEPVDITVLDSAPRFHEARIMFPYLESWFLPWSKLTLLMLNSCLSGRHVLETLVIDIDLIIEILSHCRSLENFCFDCDFRYCPSVIEAASTFAVLPELRSLYMVFLMNNDEVRLALLFKCMTRLVLPKLQTLSLGMNWIDYRWDDSFIQFFSHFSNSLEHLQFDYSPIPLQVAFGILEHLPNVTSMYLSLSVGPVPISGWNGIVEALTFGRTAHGRQRLAPRLTRLAIYWAIDHPSDDEGLAASIHFFDAVATLIESRWQAWPRSVQVRETSEENTMTQCLTTVSIGFSEEDIDVIRRAAPSQHARIARCVAEGLHLVHGLECPNAFWSEEETHACM